MGASVPRNAPVGAPDSSTAGAGWLPCTSRGWRCGGKEPKVCIAKLGCQTTIHYVISCSAGGRFPSVTIILFCLISQFCKSYC